MSIDFPANPATNDTYTVGGTTYIFDGTKWTSQSTVTESPNNFVIDYIVKTSNYTASVGEGVLTDTSGGSFSVGLPSSPAIGDTVVVADSGGVWGTNNLNVLRNGETIEDAAEDLVADVNNISITFIYDGTTWKVYTQAGSVSGSAGGSITVSNETQSTSNFYPTFSDITSDTLSTIYTSDTKLFFQPSTGTLNATALNSLSDRRFKDNIQTIDSALDKVNSLTGVSFTFKNTGKESIGLIAQDVNEVIPEVVEHNEETDTMTVSYGNLVGLLVEAIKEQQIEINNLKKNQLDGK